MARFVGAAIEMNRMGLLSSESLLKVSQACGIYMSPDMCMDMCWRLCRGAVGAFSPKAGHCPNTRHHLHLCLRHAIGDADIELHSMGLPASESLTQKSRRCRAFITWQTGRIRLDKDSHCAMGSSYGALTTNDRQKYQIMCDIENVFFM